MFLKRKLIVITFLIVNGLVFQAFSDTIKKKTAPEIIKFSGTVIDNKSLKEHQDSLSMYINSVTKDQVRLNVKTGYSIYLKEGKTYNLCHQSTECIWNGLSNPHGASLHSIKIAGNAQKIGKDSLMLIDYVEVK